MRFEEFEDCLTWWAKREENEHAWRVRAENVLSYDAYGKLISVNLDAKNPNTPADFEHMRPKELIESIYGKESKILSLLGEIKNALSSGQ